jgi:hypothetical protein
MHMPRKMGDKAYQKMLEARPDRNWLPVLEEWKRDTAPPPRERKRPNALLRNPFKR